MKPYDWFSGFDPCWILGDSQVGWWVTDRYRIHRIRFRYRVWLEWFGYVDGPMKLTFDGGVPEAWDCTGYDLHQAMKWLDVSRNLRVFAVPARGHVQMVTSDMQTIHVNRYYYECAVRDGTHQWRGSAPGRVVFGIDESGEVQTVVKSLTTAAPPSPALRPVPRPGRF